MVKAQLDASVNDSIPTEAKKAVLSKTLIATPELAPEIASLSWQIQDRGLFTAAIIAQFKYLDRESFGPATNSIVSTLTSYAGPQLSALIRWEDLCVRLLCSWYWSPH